MRSQSLSGLLLFLAACGANEAAPSAPVASASAAVATTAAPSASMEHSEHAHAPLPPVGPNVRVSFEGKRVDVPLATLPHQGDSASLVDLWKAAWPAQSVDALKFDLTGSDGFHPASKPPCAKPLTATEIARAHIDVTTHNVTYDGLALPGCYRVKAVTALDASR